MNRIFGYDSPLVSALMKIGDCICASAMFLVFSIPIVTAGASATALYATIYRCVRRDETGLWQVFWGAFRENFKRSTLAWLLELTLIAVLTVDVFVLRSIKLSGGAMGALYWAALILWLVALTWTVYVAGYAARFNGTVREVLKYGWLLMVLHPVKALRVLLAVTAALVLVLVAPFMVLAAPAAVYWVSSVVLEKVFVQHLRPEDRERENAENRGKERGNLDDQ